MICFQELPKSLIALVPRGSVKKFPITVLALLLAFCLFVAAPLAEAQADGGVLTGLRQGRVHFLVGDKTGQVTVDFQPTYGWSEPLLFYGPDGRLINKTFPNRQASGQLIFKLDRGPGHYVLVLKPSYLCRVTSTTGKMVYQPPVEQTGLRVSYGQQELYFAVPDGVPNFTLYWVNFRSFVGSAGRLTLYDPKGRTVSDQSAPKIDTAEVIARLKALGVDTSKLNTSSGGGDFNPDVNPCPPLEVKVANPASGIWKVVVGTPGAAPDNVGLWLDGAPSFFASKAELCWQPQLGADSAWAKVQVTDQKLNKPIIGSVGSFGPVGGPTDKGMTEYGVRAEKYFVPQPNGEPKNDNSDPNQANLANFKFTTLASLSPRPGKFSLVTFDQWSSWMNSLPLKTMMAEWAEWVNVDAEYMADRYKWDPNWVAFQFLNEPNLKMSMSQYLALLQTVGTRLKANAKTRNFPIAAPAVVSGLSKGDTVGLSFLDSRWIEETLRNYDSLVDYVSFNVYGASELEDTMLYPMLIDKVNGIIKSINSDGKIEPIIIGATSREGGLVSPLLTTGWSGGLWWASVLAQVANTGQVKVINHFNLVDKGLRQKGLFDATGKPKTQALMEQLYTKVLESGDLVKTISDHDGLEGVTVKTSGGLKMILVNKSWLTIKTAIQAPEGLTISQAVVYKSMQPMGYALSPKQTNISLAPETVLYVELK